MLIIRFSEAPDDKTSELSFIGSICFWVTNILDMPICFGLLGLSLNLFVQLYENKTSLESYGRNGKIQRRIPCIGVPKADDLSKPNPYDILWPNNLRQVFGSTMLLWWIPFYQPEMKGHGFYYPSIPRVTSQDIGIL